MVRPTNNEIVSRNNDLIELFNGNSTFFSGRIKKVYSPSELKEKIYFEAINQDIINKHISFKKFIIYLKKHGIIEEARFNFPQCRVRYLYDDPNMYEILNSFSDRVYLSNFSALCFHNLIQGDIFKQIVLSIEQTPKNIEYDELTQEDIDNNFCFKPYRHTKNIKEYKNSKIWLLNPKYSGNTGINDYRTKDTGVKFKVASVERTLIDIIINPLYCGGLEIVKQAYEAVESIDIDQMVDIYKKMDLRYPYFQAIGFMMEQTEFTLQNEFLEGMILNKEFKQHFDFYLDRQIPENDLGYNKKWRIYYPKSLFS